MIHQMILEITKLRTAVYVSNLARIGAKICQNAFRTIPDVLFVDVEKIFLEEIFGPENQVFVDLAWIWTSYGQMDVKISFCVKFCSG